MPYYVVRRYLRDTFTRPRGAIPSCRFFFTMLSNRRNDSANKSNRQRIGRHVVPSRIYSITASRNDWKKGSGGRVTDDNLRCVVIPGEFYERNTSRCNKDVALDRTRDSAVLNVHSPRNRNKPAIIILQELQLRLARRGLVASCIYWNPPRRWETYVDSENVSNSAEPDGNTRTRIPKPWEPVTMLVSSNSPNRSYPRSYKRKKR